MFRQLSEDPDSVVFEIRPTREPVKGGRRLDHHSCTQRLPAAFVFEEYSWTPIRPRVDAQYFRATLDLYTADTRAFEQRFLHGG
jgi:hypothetical protein